MLIVNDEETIASNMLLQKSNIIVGHAGCCGSQVIGRPCRVSFQESIGHIYGQSGFALAGWTTNRNKSIPFKSFPGFFKLIQLRILSCFKSIPGRFTGPMSV